MILRKPYAFLIKYFKIIHIVMFIIFAFLVFKIRDIYTFFTNYVKNGSFTYIEKMADKYMSVLIFISVIIIIVSAVFIYLLMRKKEKPILFYKILIIYGVVLLIYWIYFRNFFANLDKIEYDPLAIIIYRDITAFLYYINFFYVGFSFIRGFGFDIKKFSFDKDKRELNIEEEDSEEYELNLGLDKDNVTNYLRKEKREFRYYLKENKAFLIIFLIVGIIIGGIYIYFNYFIPNKIYAERDQLNVNGVVYRVNSSMITTLDKYSEVISNNSSFIVINMDMLNNNNDKSIEKELFRININDNYYYPVFNYNSSFDDVGTIYKDGMIIKNNVVTNINIIYKIENNFNNGDIFFELMNNKGGKNDYIFEKILLSPYIEEQKVSTFKMNDSVKINDYVIKILDYSFHDKVSYDYEKCINNICNKLNKIINPKLNDYILSLKIENLDSIDKTFLEDYLGLKYKYLGNDSYVSSKDVTILGINDDTLYLNVPKSVLNITNFEVTIKTRTDEYSISLEK